MKPKEPSGHPALLILFLIAGTMLMPLVTHAATPSWWSDYGVLTGGTANDFAAGNQGQAKWMAVSAVSELDNDLAQFGGAGSQLDNLATALLTSTSAQRNDYAAITLGQLKFLAQPFYDRLLTLGYYGPPLSTGTAMTSGTYPWLLSGQPAQDYAMANIGQIKYLFSFDVTYSSAGNGIPDWWALKYYGQQIIDSGTAVNWGAGQVTALQAYQNGWNPIDFYNGQIPTLTIVSGNNQTGAPGGFAPLGLTVIVTDSSGNPVVGAPVVFTVTSGGGGLKTSYMASPVNSVSLLTNQNAQALIYFQFPAANSSVSTVSAAAGPPGTQAQQLFSESTDNGNGTITYSSPFAPTNGSVVRNRDGSLDISWQNNTDDPSDIPISLQQQDGTWKVVATVPAGTTSVHIPAP